VTDPGDYLRDQEGGLLRSPFHGGDWPSLCMTLLTRQTVDLRCFPHEDAVFADHVRNAVQRLSAADRAGMRALEGHLRPRYPQIRLVARSPLADIIGSSVPTWYAYRDGGCLPGPDAGD
jgi:hypothetical protein